MLSKINKWLDSTLNLEPDNDSQQHTVQLAAAILLIEVSRADFDISKEEQQVIQTTLKKHFSLTDIEATNVLNYALKEHDDYTSSHPFIRLINEEMDIDEKRSLLRGLWEVAYADTKLDKYEEYHIRKIADWLYLSHADFMKIKHQVLEQIGNTE